MIYFCGINIRIHDIHVCFHIIYLVMMQNCEKHLYNYFHKSKVTHLMPTLRLMNSLDSFSFL